MKMEGLGLMNNLKKLFYYYNKLHDYKVPLFFGTDVEEEMPLILKEDRAWYCGDEVTYIINNEIVTKRIKQIKSTNSFILC